MNVSGAEEKIAAIQFRDRNVDDRIKRERESITGSARGLREFLGGIAKWQVGINKIHTQPKVFVGIPGRARGSDKATATHIGVSRAAIGVGARAGVEVPVSEIV